ncbi:potassium channel family protein [Parenemella sanctibonifatiensis]|uniref:Trk system potassium uptake protein TrkA n=1 Tax=Parenemella sanctibonifatiensis TaxID=2016505 RepID=A0A255E4F9_9ACTN|nr:TrkA family potassium uptake protein [Parenemella sanctibonifatiensis]OYN86429.1 potassium transporter TrkA [Parenemella sanctibonifatiensis]
MRVVIAGAGKAGRSIAQELLISGHDVLLVDKEPEAIRPEDVPGATWLLADACELSSLEEADLESADVAVAATGDDKANLVHSLLARSEFGVPRTIARVNHPRNEWMFTEAWGVDMAVSTPRLMCALVEEAVTVGDLVRLFTFQRSETSLMEFTLPGDSPIVGSSVGDLVLPRGAVLVAVIRNGVAVAPDPEHRFGPADELVFLLSEQQHEDLRAMLAPGNEE